MRYDGATPGAAGARKSDSGASHSVAVEHQLAPAAATEEEAAQGRPELAAESSVHPCKKVGGEGSTTRTVSFARAEAEGLQRLRRQAAGRQSLLRGQPWRQQEGERLDLDGLVLLLTASPARRRQRLDAAAAADRRSPGVWL